jgi:hypothetical protein
LLAALLAGCGAGGSPDDKMARFLVAPDKFVLYNTIALRLPKKPRSIARAKRN